MLVNTGSFAKAEPPNQAEDIESSLDLTFIWKEIEKVSTISLQRRGKYQILSNM